MEATDPREELLELSRRLRHLQAEHGRAPAEGSHRRKLEARMDEAADHLERRLAALVEDEADREGWRAHARRGAEPPDVPREAAPEVPAGAPTDRPTGRRPWPR